MTEEMKRHFEYQMGVHTKHVTEMRAQSEKCHKEAKAYELSADKAEKMAAEFKALLEPGDTVTVTLKVDTTQAQKDIECVGAKIDKLVAQFNSVSAGGSSLLTVKP